jgi:adenosine/AMP kinase
MKTEIVAIVNPQQKNLIFGQSHFIKTVEDLHETLVCSVPGISFGLAFAEASGERILRISGNHPELTELARSNLSRIGAGHTFLIFLENAYPINVLPAIKTLPEVTQVYCATANPVEVIVAETKQGRGVLGVIDGGIPIRSEKPTDCAKRKKFLRDLGYKL